MFAHGARLQANRICGKSVIFIRLFIGMQHPARITRQRKGRRRYQESYLCSNAGLSPIYSHAAPPLWRVTSDWPSPARFVCPAIYKPAWSAGTTHTRTHTHNMCARVCTQFSPSQTQGALQIPLTQSKYKVQAGATVLAVWDEESAKRKYQWIISKEKTEQVGYHRLLKQSVVNNGRREAATGVLDSCWSRFGLSIETTWLGFGEDRGLSWDRGVRQFKIFSY